MLSQFFKCRQGEIASPDEGIIKWRDKYPARVIGHKVLSVFNALIYSLKKTAQINLMN